MVRFSRRNRKGKGWNGPFGRRNGNVKGEEKGGNLEGCYFLCLMRYMKVDTIRYKIVIPKLGCLSVVTLVGINLFKGLC